MLSIADKNGQSAKLSVTRLFVCALRCMYYDLLFYYSRIPKAVGELQQSERAKSKTVKRRRVFSVYFLQLIVAGDPSATRARQVIDWCTRVPATRGFLRWETEPFLFVDRLRRFTDGDT